MILVLTFLGSLMVKTYDHKIQLDFVES